MRDILLLQPAQQVHRLAQLLRGAARRRGVVLIHCPAHLVLGLAQAVQRLPRAGRARIAGAVRSAGICAFPLRATPRALPALLTALLPAAGSTGAALLRAALLRAALLSVLRLPALRGAALLSTVARQLLDLLL